LIYIEFYYFGLLLSIISRQPKVLWQFEESLDELRLRVYKEIQCSLKHILSLFRSRFFECYLRKSEKKNRGREFFLPFDFSFDQLLRTKMASGKVGFIGLGIVGIGMAANLVKSGRHLVVWNRTAEKAHLFAKEHGTVDVVATPRAVIESCDVTYCCLTTPEVVRKVHLEGEGRTVLGMSAGKSLVDCSTLDCSTMCAVDEAVKEKGGRFLEAPVSGSKGPAAQVFLSFF
jgi:NAD binding domain of 6-phosphogluconate dehydrogenase